MTQSYYATLLYGIPLSDWNPPDLARKLKITTVQHPEYGESNGKKYHWLKDIEIADFADDRGDVDRYNYLEYLHGARLGDSVQVYFLIKKPQCSSCWNASAPAMGSRCARCIQPTLPSSGR